MSKRQRIIIVAWAIIVMLITLFPPFQILTQGAQYYGHTFILFPVTTPSDSHMLVEPGRLVAELGFITALAASIFALWGTSR